jgi:hypothetical protein
VFIVPLFAPLLAYGIALLAALALIRYFHGSHCHWYWHVLAVVVAFGIGLMPPPEKWSGPALDVTVGTLFVFLFIWGAAGPFAHPRHHH